MKRSNSNSLEFVLVIIMLGVLTLLVAFILFTPTSTSNLPFKDGKGLIDSIAYKNYLEDSKMYYQSSLEYKKSLLAIILTAFGAWVGAGAAYFFGRENLRESANSLLELHQQMLGVEKLGLLKVRDIPPKPLDGIFDEKSTIEDVNKRFLANPKDWFVVIKSISNDWSVISKEGIYIYMTKEMELLYKTAGNETKPYSEINSILIKEPLKDILSKMKNDEHLKQYLNKYVIVSIDENAAAVNEKMDREGIFLAIIKNTADDFIQYFTTSDIRKALLKI